MSFSFFILLNLYRNFTFENGFVPPGSEFGLRMQPRPFKAYVYCVLLVVSMYTKSCSDSSCAVELQFAGRHCTWLIKIN